MHKTLHKTSLFIHTHTPKGCAPFCAVESISGLPDTLFKSLTTLIGTKKYAKGDEASKRNNINRLITINRLNAIARIL